MASPPIITHPTTPHTHTVIFLHGRGSSATAFRSEIFESQDSSGLYFTQLFPSVKWVFPCAELRWSERDREEMHQWFDMANVQNAQENPDIQRPGLEESRTQLLGIIAAEEKLVLRQRIVVAGISQGCAVALWTLLSADASIGGFFGLCGWLPLADDLEKTRGTSQGRQENGDMPILLQHCNDDGVVPIANGKAMRDHLEERGMNVKWQQFEEGGHWLNEPDGMDGVVEFLTSIIAATPQ